MRFIIRWLVTSLGLWVAIALLGDDRISAGNRASTILIAGLILAIINILLKPLLVFLSLPAIILTLGLFMIVVNGLLLLIASKLYLPLHVKSLGVAMVAGMVIGLVNYLVTSLLGESKET